ncbi:F-box domain protein [Aspergillus sclerotialis]|uniref:F-box domain protein n=1 Tax=Aspergillus sclerotialis TaxID=2070753 RepID=A0A3A2ZJ11_9EURO|nr:F-box domain protein [Aspergillus sclerotialis]
MSDERSLLYTVNKDGLQDGKQAIILINFDPMLRLPGLERLPLHNAKGKRAEAAVGIERPQVGDIEHDRRPVPLKPATGTRTNQTLPSVREEPAMYLSINQGYWLR